MSFFSGLLKIGGAAGGFALGGPAGALAGYQLGSAVGGGGGGNASQPKAGGLDAAGAQQKQYAEQDRNRFVDTLSNGQNAVNASTQAAVQNALPSYMQNLQGSRESAIRRGTSNGDLQTSNEGDLASAFQRNVSNAAAGQSANVYGQQVQGYGQLAHGSEGNYLDILAGNADRDQANKNNKYGLAAGVIGAAGQIGGAYAAQRFGRKTP